MNNPRKVDVTAIKTTPEKSKGHWMPPRSTKNDANRTGMNALIIPKMIAPVVFASIRRFRLIGERSNRSNERLFLSNVIVTESMEVVPKRIDSAMTPGRMALISTSLPLRKKNIRVHEMGKMIPQLKFGGFR
jgi:hypothetical protein